MLPTTNGADVITFLPDGQEVSAAGEEHVAAMERFTHEIGGFVPLYQDVWMNRTQFEEMFDHRLYRQMREKLGAVGAFPEVWGKVRLQPELRTATSRAQEDEVATDVQQYAATTPDA